MTLMELYQRQVRAGYITRPDVDKKIHAVLGLAGEAGEVADLIKKGQYLGHPEPTRDEMLNELGDVLWYLAALADQYGISLEDLAIANVTKLAERHRGKQLGYDPEELLGALA